jgi:G:T-mismatch repair DNA endonuclease (very short patch repair protein)
VTVDVITTEGESDVMANMQRKADATEKMFAMIVQEMGNELKIQQRDLFPQQEAIPSWL